MEAHNHIPAERVTELQQLVLGATKAPITNAFLSVNAKASSLHLSGPPASPLPAPPFSPLHLPVSRYARSPRQRDWLQATTNHITPQPSHPDPTSTLADEVERSAASLPAHLDTAQRPSQPLPSPASRSSSSSGVHADPHPAGTPPGPGAVTHPHPLPVTPRPRVASLAGTEPPGQGACLPSPCLTPTPPPCTPSEPSSWGLHHFWAPAPTHPLPPHSPPASPPDPARAPTAAGAVTGAAAAAGAPGEVPVAHQLLPSVTYTAGTPHSSHTPTAILCPALHPSAPVAPEPAVMAMSGDSSSSPDPPVTVSPPAAAPPAQPSPRLPPHTLMPARTSEVSRVAAGTVVGAEGGEGQSGRRLRGTLSVQAAAAALLEAHRGQRAATAAAVAAKVAARQEQRVGLRSSWASGGTRPVSSMAVPGGGRGEGGREAGGAGGQLQGNVPQKNHGDKAVGGGKRQQQQQWGEEGGLTFPEASGVSCPDLGSGMWSSSSLRGGGEAGTQTGAQFRPGSRGREGGGGWGVGPEQLVQGRVQSMGQVPVGVAPCGGPRARISSGSGKAAQPQTSRASRSSGPASPDPHLDQTWPREQVRAGPPEEQQQDKEPDPSPALLPAPPRRSTNEDGSTGRVGTPLTPLLLSRQGGSELRPGSATPGPPPGTMRRTTSPLLSPATPLTPTRPSSTASSHRREPLPAARPPPPLAVPAQLAPPPSPLTAAGRHPPTAPATTPGPCGLRPAPPATLPAPEPGGSPGGAPHPTALAQLALLPSMTSLVAAAREAQQGEGGPGSSLAAPPGAGHLLAARPPLSPPRLPRASPGPYPLPHPHPPTPLGVPPLSPSLPTQPSDVAFCLEQPYALVATAGNLGGGGGGSGGHEPGSDRSSDDRLLMRGVTFSRGVAVLGEGAAGGEGSAHSSSSSSTGGGSDSSGSDQDTRAGLQEQQRATAGTGAPAGGPCVDNAHAPRDPPGGYVSLLGGSIAVARTSSPAWQQQEPPSAPSLQDSLMALLLPRGSIPLSHRTSRSSTPSSPAPGRPDSSPGAAGGQEELPASPAPGLSHPLSSSPAAALRSRLSQECCTAPWRPGSPPGQRSGGAAGEGRLWAAAPGLGDLSSSAGQQCCPASSSAGGEGGARPQPPPPWVPSGTASPGTACPCPWLAEEGWTDLLTSRPLDPPPSPPTHALPPPAAAAAAGSRRDTCSPPPERRQPMPPPSPPHLIAASRQTTACQGGQPAVVGSGGEQQGRPAMPPGSPPRLSPAARSPRHPQHLKLTVASQPDT
ncbi:hypothetical protein V8C86DRAFT_3210331 [Haematococcus lacustris]